MGQVIEIDHLNLSTRTLGPTTGSAARHGPPPESRGGPINYLDAG